MDNDLNVATKDMGFDLDDFRRWNLSFWREYEGSDNVSDFPEEASFLSYEMINDILVFLGYVGNNEEIDYGDITSGARIFPLIRVFALEFIPNFFEQTSMVKVKCLISRDHTNGLRKKGVFFQSFSKTSGKVIENRYFFYDDWSDPDKPQLVECEVEL